MNTLSRTSILVKASKKYNEEFIKEIGKAVKDIVEGRVKSYEELLEEYSVRKEY